ncbi:MULTISPECIES: hypothetical protein [Hyphobacterium]|uniref:Uncharacterized protein n=1 Tax=Hyphobacterium vulgare TaxID=1736751 RepID=A0ABV6ZT43_9PROT
MKQVTAYSRRPGVWWIGEAARITALAAGGLLTLLGVTIAVTPLPFGAVVLAAGLVTLISASPSVASTVRNLRTHFSPFDATLLLAERCCPATIARVLRTTLPDSPLPAAAKIRA